MASGVFAIYKANLMNKMISSTSDNIVVCLMTATAFVATAQNYLTYVSGAELAATGGYVKTGSALGSKTVTLGTTTVFDAADSVWTSSSFTAGVATLVDITVNPTSDNLICLFDFAGDKTVSSGTFTIQWNSLGIVTLV